MIFSEDEIEMIRHNMARWTEGCVRARAYPVLLIAIRENGDLSVIESNVLTTEQAWLIVATLAATYLNPSEESLLRVEK